LVVVELVVCGLGIVEMLLVLAPFIFDIEEELVLEVLDTD